MKKLFLGIFLFTSFIHAAEEYKLTLGLINIANEQAVYTLVNSFRAGFIWHEEAGITKPLSCFLYKKNPKGIIKLYNGIIEVPLEAISEDAAMDIANMIVRKLNIQERNIASIMLSCKQAGGNWKSDFLDNELQEDCEKVAYYEQEQ